MIEAIYDPSQKYGGLYYGVLPDGTIVTGDGITDVTRALNGALNPPPTDGVCEPKLVETIQKRAKQFGLGNVTCTRVNYANSITPDPILQTPNWIQGLVILADGRDIMAAEFFDRVGVVKGQNVQLWTFEDKLAPYKALYPNGVIPVKVIPPSK